jgi:hypothetical protein
MTLHALFPEGCLLGPLGLDGSHLDLAHSARHSLLLRGDRRLLNNFTHGILPLHIVLSVGYLRGNDVGVPNLFGQRRLKTGRKLASVLFLGRWLHGDRGLGLGFGLTLLDLVGCLILLEDLFLQALHGILRLLQPAQQLLHLVILVTFRGRHVWVLYSFVLENLLQVGWGL